MHYSILIPTLNESANIGDAITSSRAALGKDAEIIVTDGGSEDDTVSIAESLGARIIQAECGRGIQLDAALRAASGDVCILLHADTRLPADAARLIAGHRAGAFSLTFDGNQLPWLAAAINLRARIFNNPTGDHAMFATRELLLSIGGIPHVELFEDVLLWGKLKRAGRTTLLKAKVTTSARLWNQLGTWRGILLHWRLRVLHRLGMSPGRLARMYPTSSPS